MAFRRNILRVAVILSGILASQCAKGPPKFFYLNSFHPGDVAADSVTAGIQNVSFSGKGPALESFFMDLKRHPDETFLKQKIQETIKAIKKSDPNVMIVYGDEAVKTIVAPYFRKGPLPVVFCGVTWACEPYGLPTEAVTGMLDVLPIQAMVHVLKAYYPEMHQLAVISENSISERKSIKYVDALLRPLGIRVNYQLVDQFSKWQNAFVRANEEADLIYLSSSGAVSGWNDAQAAEFVWRHIQKPVIACDRSMMRFAVFGITPVDREQGAWAARTAMQILSGTSVRDIPVTVNRETRRYFNPVLAERIRFSPKPDFLNQVQKVE